MKVNPIIKVALKAILSLLALYYVSTKIDLKILVKTLSGIHWALFTDAVLFFIISKMISSIRLNMFLKSTGIILSEKFSMKLYWLGMYYNLFLPGGIGGDGYKVYLLSRNYKISTKKIITALLVDRFTGILALFCLVVALGYFLNFPSQYKYWLWLLIPLSTWLVWLLIRKFFPRYGHIFFTTNLLSFGVQLSQLVAAIFILYAIDQSTQIHTYLFVFLISSVVAIIPFTIGGMGARELTFITGARLLGLDIHVSVALSMIFFIISAAVSLWGITYSFRKMVEVSGVA